MINRPFMGNMLYFFFNYLVFAYFPPEIAYNTGVFVNYNAPRGSKLSLNMLKEQFCEVCYYCIVSGGNKYSIFGNSVHYG